MIQEKKDYKHYKYHIKTSKVMNELVNACFIN